ncbi:MAG: preprotein translocase subunit SecG [Candidatus Dependentiae bacterium ADurb.Bin331]|nr:MAG: preprotein translocase subunit SecG [Candidatus Dependentiae bacterium ADurb.Bin331]
MIFGLLVTFYFLLCLFLLLLILLQKGKGSMGLGNLGGGAQLLFGGSGGQDLFQKITWVLGALFMGGSLALSIMKTSNYRSSRYLEQQTQSVVWKKPTV